MYSGKLVFAQLMEHFPLHTFRSCVERYPSKYSTKSYSHLDQFICIAFAQLTYRKSLRDILKPEARSFYIMDRGFTNFARWFTLHQAQAFYDAEHDSHLVFMTNNSSDLH